MTNPTHPPGGRSLGYVPDAPDDRDHIYTVPENVPHQFVDLAADPAMPPIWDQGQLGSCTAHGTGAAAVFAAAKTDTPIAMPSRLELYYNSRALEGTTSSDSGAQIRDAIKAMGAGVAPETEWPYDIANFAEKPTAQVVADSTEHAVSYASVETSRAALQTCLSEGFPVVNGLTLFPSFEDQEAIDTGIVKHPTKGEQTIGGHCMLICGIGFGHEWKAGGQFPDAVDGRLYLKLRNSWGTGVYADGYLLMGVPYQSRFGNDFWTIRSAS